MIKAKLTKKKKSKSPQILGSYFIWPDGKKTHIRYIYNAVTKGRPLPKGLFKLADADPKLVNLRRIVAAARKRGLKDTATR